MRKTRSTRRPLRRATSIPKRAIPASDFFSSPEEDPSVGVALTGVDVNTGGGPKVFSALL